MKINHSSKLIEVRYQEKEYIGQYIEAHPLVLSEIENLQNELQKKIESLISIEHIENISCHLFPQVFIK